MLDLVEGLGEGDFVLALISGGASALLVRRPGVSLADKQAVNGALLASGAPIGEMNIVRKHLSPGQGRAAGGGCIARADAGAPISDVPGDDPR